MNKSKLLMASSLAFVMVGAASAQTDVRITGSTAYRAAVYNAIESALASGYTYGYVGSSLSSASEAIFHGTVSGNEVYIKTAFTGSVGGVAAVSGLLTVGTGGTAYGGGQFLSDSNSLPNGVISSPTYDSAEVPDITLSDSYQSSAPDFPSQSVDYRTPKLSGNVVGVVPFEWVATPGKAAVGTVTNITSAQAVTLLKGTLKLSALSGSSSDTEAVYAVGRDEDSGTRIAALADIAWTKDSNGNLTGVTQYQPLYNSNTTPVLPQPTPGTVITGATVWPSPTPGVDGISYPVGDSGFNSGGSLANAVNVTHTASGTTYNPWFVSYFGLNDATTVLGGIGKLLDFNSVAYSAAAVEDGQYTFWSYEHLLYRGSNFPTNEQLGTVGVTVANALISAIKGATTISGGIPLSDMSVHRTGDGGTPVSGGTGYPTP